MIGVGVIGYRYCGPNLVRNVAEQQGSARPVAHGRDEGANWLAPGKVRRTLLGGGRRMIVFDEVEASEKLSVYDRGIAVTDGAMLMMNQGRQVAMERAGAL